MYSDILSKRSMSLPYQQNKNNIVTSLKNTYNTQGQIYSNTKIINNSNSSIKQINLNNSYNTLHTLLEDIYVIRKNSFAYMNPKRKCLK